MLELTVVIIGVLINAGLGIFVFTRHTRHIVNQLYGLLAFSLVVWPIANYLSLQTDDRLFFIRLVVCFVVITSTALFYLVSVFPDQNAKFSRWQWTGIIFSVLTAALCLTPVVFQGLSGGDNPVPVPNYGVLLFLLHLGIFFLGSLILLLIRVHRSQGRRRLQFIYIFVGAVPLFILGPVTGFLLPVVFQYANFAALSPVYATFFAVLVGYATLKHRLFDLRLIVARSVAYSLVIATLGLSYGFVVFGFVDQFFPDANMGVLQQSIYVISAIFLAFTFQPLRRFFDKWTDRVFYRDNYETEDILNQLGKIFVAKSNSFELLDDSLKIITDTLKTQDSSIAVLDEGEIYKTTSTSHDSEANISVNALRKFEDQLTVYDEVQENGKLYDAFHELNAYAVLRLTVQDELVGYLILGSKQTGTIFTQQDVNLLEILAQELAVAIQNVKSYQKIANFSQTLQREVEEATAQLRESNQRLRKLDEAKDEFISMASHQLRTPLTTIKGYLSMLLDGDAGKLNKNQRQFIDQAFIGSQRMVYLISDMLNVSRISTGKLTIDKKSLNVVDIVKSEVDQLRQQAETRDVQLTFHPPEEGEIWLELDEGKVRQVAMNFIDNAIYYAPKGTVDVYVEKTNGSVECRVVDDGIGVSEEAQKQLFTKFFRAENARHVRPDGTGLGLYMAKQVVEAQGGEVIFESTEGEGSTFGFRFPLENQEVDQ